MVWGGLVLDSNALVLYGLNPWIPSGLDLWAEEQLASCPASSLSSPDPCSTAAVSPIRRSTTGVPKAAGFRGSGPSRCLPPGISLPRSSSHWLALLAIVPQGPTLPQDSTRTTSFCSIRSQSNHPSLNR